MSQSRNLSRFSFPRFLRNDAIFLGPVAVRPDADEDFLGKGRLTSEPGSSSESTSGGFNSKVRLLETEAATMGAISPHAESGYASAKEPDGSRCS